MNFQQADAIGKYGEKVFTKRLRYKGFNIIDASQHPLFQEWDIDFVTQYGDKVYTIEVKTDRYEPNNFAFEIISNDNKGTPGCLYQSRADLWCYIFKSADTGFVFKPDVMVRHIENNDFKQFTRATTTRSGKHLYNSVGVLVPVAEAPVAQRIPNFSKFEQLNGT